MESFKSLKLASIPKSQADIELTETIFKVIDDLHKSLNHPSGPSNDPTSYEGFYFVEVKARLAQMYPNEKHDHFKVESSLTYLYWADLIFAN
jgi:hypothetical protein